MKPKIVIITGLTCSGKSKLGLQIAKEFSGEIISADSVQIYKGLDIGSAKESKLNRRKIPHHLIDILNFNCNFNVSQFVNGAISSINNIIKNKHLPVIVGGTGLYIKALLEGFNFSNTENHAKFRENLEHHAKEQGNLAVWEILNKQNPQKARTVHFNNLKRVIRYLEIEEFGENEENTTKPLEDFDVLALAIIDEREKIYKRINQRVDEMLAKGLCQEVERLISAGATREMQSMNTIGYKEWFDYFDGKTDYNKTVELIKQHSRNYCKRQLTFLKTIPELKLCDYTQAEKKIRSFLND